MQQLSLTQTSHTRGFDDLGRIPLLPRPGKRTRCLSDDGSTAVEAAIVPGKEPASHT